MKTKHIAPLLGKKIENGGVPEGQQAVLLLTE